MYTVLDAVVGRGNAFHTLGASRRLRVAVVRRRAPLAVVRPSRILANNLDDGQEPRRRDVGRGNAIYTVFVVGVPLG